MKSSLKLVLHQSDDEQMEELYNEDVFHFSLLKTLTL